MRPLDRICIAMIAVAFVVAVLAWLYVASILFYIVA